MDRNRIRQQANQIYDPQIENVREQIGSVGGMFDPQREAERQAKRNAFRDIDASTAERGVFYSGAVPQEQGEYLSETFAPNMTQINQQEAQKRQDLTSALSDLLISRGENVLDRIDTQRELQQERTLSRKERRNRRKTANIRNQASRRAAGF